MMTKEQVLRLAVERELIDMIREAIFLTDGRKYPHYHWDLWRFHAALAIPYDTSRPLAMQVIKDANRRVATGENTAIEDAILAELDKIAPAPEVPVE